MRPTGKMRRKYRDEGSTTDIPINRELLAEADRILLNDRHEKHGKSYHKDSDGWFTETQLATRATKEVFVDPDWYDGRAA